jgi:hypothetical protein
MRPQDLEPALPSARGNGSGSKRRSARGARSNSPLTLGSLFRMSLIPRTRGWRVTTHGQHAMGTSKVIGNPNHQSSELMYR